MKCGNSTEVLRLYALYWSGLLPFSHLSFDSLQMPWMNEAYMHDLDKEHKKESLTYKLNEWILWLMLSTSKPLFTHLGKRGIHVMFWVANEEEDVNLINQRYGDSVHGIITDRPQHLR